MCTATHTAKNQLGDGKNPPNHPATTLKFRAIALALTILPLQASPRYRSFSYCGFTVFVFPFVFRRKTSFEIFPLSFILV
jgi:hypothetical protein